MLATWRAFTSGAIMIFKKSVRVNSGWTLVEWQIVNGCGSAGFREVSARWVYPILWSVLRQFDMPSQQKVKIELAKTK